MTTEKFIGMVNDANDKTPYCFDCINITTNVNCTICIDKDNLPKNIEIKDSKEFLIEIIENSVGNIDMYCDDEDNVEYVESNFITNSVKYQLVNFSLYNNSKVEKIDSKKCKEKIVEYCLQNKDEIKKEFSPLLSEIQFLETQKIKNWKRYGKEKCEDISNRYNGEQYIERCFDCISFEGQLRGYVETNMDDTEILSLYVQGE